MAGTLAVSVAAAGFAEPVGAARQTQWGLDRLAIEFVQQDVDGTGVIVAVVDTSIALGHDDLRGQFVDGWDAVDGRAIRVDDPTWARAATDHGTMVAGVIAGRADATGITGVAPGAKIMPIRAVPDDGRGDTRQLAEGIRWAVDNGADVVNVSIRSTTDSARVRAAVDHAAANGVIVVASAGRGPSVGPFYPAALDTVIAVGAVDSDLGRHVESPVNAAVELVAPGVDIVTTSGTDTDGYLRGFGTSFAAPHVAGVVAIMRQIAPDASLDEVREALHQTAFDLGNDGRDDEFGHGFVDAVGSLMWIDRRAPQAPVTRIVDARGGTVRVEWQSSSSFDVLSYEVLVDGRVAATLPREASTATVQRPEADSQVTVRAVDASGRTSTADPAEIDPFVARGLAVVTSTGRAVAFDRAVPFANVTGAVAAAGDLDGYWLVDANGSVVPRGDARHLGDAVGLDLNAPIVDIAATPSGEGYWLLGSDGGVYSFGDARFAGSVADLQLDRPAIALVPTATGDGYWIVAKDGGVFALGDAPFLGSASGMTLDGSIRHAATDGSGYWLLGSDGGVFSFGSTYHGRTNGAAARLVADAGGYLVFGDDGRITALGAAAGRANVQLLPGEFIVGVLSGD